MRIIRRKEVTKKTGLGPSSIYDKMQKGKFPEPVSLGLRAVGWLESDIDDWINNLQKQGWKKTAGVGVKK